MEGSPADHPSAPTIDTNHLQQGQPSNLTADPQQLNGNGIPLPQTPNESSRKPKGPSVRRACASCHSGKTRCSEVLPCQSCLKRGLGDSCAYPDPDVHDQPAVHPGAVAGYPPQPLAYPPQMAGMPQQPYYDYNTFAPAAAAVAAAAGQPPTPTPASSSSFRPAKRPRNLTEEETAAITRYTRGDFFVGTSAPVRIDPRLPVRLTLGEGDQVHFTITEQVVYP